MRPHQGGKEPVKRMHVLIAAGLVLSCLALGQVDGQSSGNPKAEQELRNLVRMWDEAVVKGDTATLDRLLADEFAFVGGPNKAEYLASLKSMPPVESAESVDMEVLVYGDTAVVTGLDIMRVKNKGQASVQRWQYMDAWVRRAGRWQCVRTYSNFLNKPSETKPAPQ